MEQTGKFIRTKETLLKMSLARKRYIQRMHESGKKLNGWPKGIHRREETKQKIKQTLTGKCYLTEVGRRKISESRKGEKAYQWIKDRKEVSHRYKESLSSIEYRKWRTEVYKRDNWKCRIADKNCNGSLEAHHILNWKDYPKLRFAINNGITVCKFHHPRGRKNESKLSPYFQEILQNE